MRMILFSIWMFLAAVAAFTVFYVSSLVREQEEYIRTLNSNISMIKEDINILHAEWSLLTNPERIEKLAHIYLPDMTVMKAEQGMPNILEIAYAQNTGAGASLALNSEYIPAMSNATNAGITMYKMPSPPYPTSHLSEIAMIEGNR